jgi:septation ring formation regulator EzrA
MWYIVIGIIVLGILAAVAGHFRNKKLEGMLESGRNQRDTRSTGTFRRMLRSARNLRKRQPAWLP